MKKIYFVLFFLPLALFGQSKTEYPSFIPAKLKVKPLMDKDNYIDQKAQFAIVQYLQDSKLNPHNYYVDSSIVKSRDTLFINIWDIYGLKSSKRIEKKLDSLNKINSIRGKKLKLPKPLGNPGNCFTAYFDTKNNILIAAELWQ